MSETKATAPAGVGTNTPTEAADTVAAVMECQREIDRIRELARSAQRHATKAYNTAGRVVDGADALQAALGRIKGQAGTVRCRDLPASGILLIGCAAAELVPVRLDKHRQEQSSQ